MDLVPIYENTQGSSGLQTQAHNKDEEKDRKQRGSSRCLLLMTVILGLICVVLLLVIIQQHISITAERDLFNNTVEELKDTISRLQHNNTDVKTEKQQDFIGLFLPPSNEEKSWSESRQYCRDRGGDLVIIKTEEKQRFVSSIVKERVWIGLSDIESEGNMKWVDNSTLNQGCITVQETVAHVQNVLQDLSVFPLFWIEGQPSDYNYNEDCTELHPDKPVLNNWNDHLCTDKKKWICEI